jgi:hypothetical protein
MLAPPKSTGKGSAIEDFLNAGHPAIDVAVLSRRFWQSLQVKRERFDRFVNL